jgi:hypothetical protein
MAIYTVWMLEESNISISGSGSLDGITQGNGSHLLNRTITINQGKYIRTLIRDNDPDFEDNDTSQQWLSVAQTIGGVAYPANTRVEAEYSLVLQDSSDPPRQWTVYGYNVNNSDPTFRTVEGLAFRPADDGSFPPVGTPLSVVDADEGPFGLGSNPYLNFVDPPCFVPGTLIDTPNGPRTVETLQPGDLVLTRDHGPQPLRWVGRLWLSAADLGSHPKHRPVRIHAGSLGDGLPIRPLVLSPQHRILVSGWRSELLFGEVEVLVPALAMVGDRADRVADQSNGILYLHLLFDGHEIIRAEGAEVESLLPDWASRANLPPALKAELEDLVSRMEPGKGPHDAGAARSCLTLREGRLLA